MRSASPRLLSSDDPPVCGVENENGRSAILFVSDHAGRHVPAALGTLGLAEARLAAHIGWDIGIYAVTSELARALDATYVFQRYSRLVIDCNRRSGIAQSIAVVSDGTPIPGNGAITEADRNAREEEVFAPYHREIARLLEVRRSRGLPTALVAMHSCTPRLHRETTDRPWQISLIARDDWRLGNAMKVELEARGELLVGVNEPYVVDPEVDYTVPVHAEEAGLPYVEIEIRQDLIGDVDGQARWTGLLAEVFPKALERAGIGRHR